MCRRTPTQSPRIHSVFSETLPPLSPQAHHPLGKSIPIDIRRQMTPTHADRLVRLVVTVSRRLGDVFWHREQEFFAHEWNSDKFAKV